MTSPIVVTRFSDASGRIEFDASDTAYRYRARAQGYVDAYFNELPEELVQETPLSHSICQHSVAIEFQLVIDDTNGHPLLKDNLAVSELGIGAYLGAPIHVHKGTVIGAICALEFQPRNWSVQDIEFITLAAGIADGLLIRAV